MKYWKHAGLIEVQNSVISYLNDISVHSDSLYISKCLANSIPSICCISALLVSSATNIKKSTSL